MFIGLDGVVESLTNAISATETEISVSGSIATQIGANTSKLRITDGVYIEYVKVTGVAGTKLTVLRGQDGTTARAWAASACVSYVVTTAIVCELIAQGGCASTGVCTAVTYGTKSVPTAVIGKPWSAIVAFSNATSVSVEAKPSWVTATINANVAILTGTPPVGAITEPLIVKANGCNASVVVVHDSIEICEQVGV